MKLFLSNLDEIIDYELSLNPSMDEDFLRDYLLDEYGQKVSAVLKEIPVDQIKSGPNSNHLKDKKQQEIYNKQFIHDPILLSSSFEIQDGHHRYRAAVVQKKSSILAYVLSE